MRKTRVRSLGWEDSLEKEMATHSSILAWQIPWTSLVVLVVKKKKKPPANAGDIKDMGSILGWGRSPGEGNATHSSILVWEVPWTEEPGRLQSLQWQRVRHD